MGGNGDGCRQAADGAPEAAVRASGGGSLNPPPSLRRLLAGAIDYAGLFPPASLPMADAAASYASYRGAEDAWALGRFVVPHARVAELARVVDVVRGYSGGDAWGVSVVCAPDLAAGVNAMAALRDAHRGTLAVDAVETRVGTVAEAAGLGPLVAAGFEVFAEITPVETMEDLAVAISRAGAAAKLRTGGVTPDAFPEPRAVARFLRACHRSGVRFKATAGLHHPLRGEYPLTYERGAPCGTMHGFLNILLAAALVVDGRPDDIVMAVLEERSPDAITMDGASISWRDVRFTSGMIDAVRARLIAGFGSCSFREPLDELPRVLEHVA